MTGIKHSDDSRLENARQILDNYLSLSNHRKTPERYAVLEAVYGMKGLFTMEELYERLERVQFRVSRATLYSTMKLFLELHLVVKHQFSDGMKYEAYHSGANHCYRVCTVCGKTSVFKEPKINAAIDSLKLSRFRKAGFSLYVFGVCSSCQAKITRMKKQKEKKQK